MDTRLVATLTDLYHLNFALLCLIVGLYGYGFYAMMLLTRILRDIERHARRPEQR